MELERFQENIGVTFKDPDLLKRALTHRSYINENPSKSLKHNERLEFLGDAVMELVVTEYLFDVYPEKNEGELTSYRAALVNTHSLSEVAQKLEIEKVILMSRGETKDTGRARNFILANSVEAIIGAIHLDQGYPEAKKFIDSFIISRLQEVLESGSWIDDKSLFQEKAQEEVGVTPTYKTLKQEGPDHAKHFTVGVYLGKEEVSQGEGDSKQEAEQVAARKALEEKNWK